MIQLILDVTGNGIVLPESIKGGYRVWEDDGGTELEMISRRIVRELRGNVWRISYQYGWFDDETKNLVIASCVKGKKEPISCAFLPPNSNEMITSLFFITNFNYPKFMWSVQKTENNAEVSVPMWADFSMELREVSPHD